jgi:hypothetical protein
MPLIQAGNDQTYVLFIGTEQNDDVTDVTGGNGLTWTERKQQCGSNGATGMRVWTAQGSPGSAFQVQITYNAANDLGAVLARYEGVDGFEDPTGENINGENDVTCADGGKSASAPLTLTSSQGYSVHAIGISSNNKAVSSVSPGYDLVDNETQGKAYTHVYHKTFASATEDTFTADLNGQERWVTAGTFQAWETDRDGDLVGENRREVGVAYNDATPFAAGVTIQDSTTDADHYMKLTVAEGQRHDGTAGTGARIDAQGGVGDYIVQLRDDYSVLEWLEITDFQDDKGAVMTWDGQDVALNHLLIHDFDSLAAAIEMYHGGTIRNSIIYDGDSGLFFNMSAEGQTGVAENCTIKTLWYGVKSWPGAYPVEIRNTIVAGANSAHFDLQNDTIDYFGYNMFDPAKINGFALPQDGGHQVLPANLDDLFLSITPGSEDFHLEEAGHSAMDTGLNLSADFVMDIDGQTRIAPWDIGADWNPMGTFYRSIGTDTGVVYGVGDASVALGSSIVTFGFGADLPTNVGCGDELEIGAETFYILSRDSATQVTVQLPAATPHSNEAYTIQRVYNTLQAWEDDVDGDLVADKRSEIGVCYNDGWFTDRLVISGSTTDADHYMRLTVAEGQRHNGLPNTGAGVDGITFGGLDSITVEDEYTRSEWLEIKAATNAGDAIFFDDSPPADNGLVYGVFVHSHWQNSNAGVRTAAPNTTIRNSFFTGGTTSAIAVDTGCTMAIIENCTMIGNSAGGMGVSDGPGTTVSIKNTISVNHPAGDDFKLWSNIAYFDYNMFSSVTPGFATPQDGGNQLPPSTLERLFVDVSNPALPDLHLETWGHHAGNTGLDLSSDFTDDIDGTTRVDSWDIGADEGVTGTDPLPPVIISWKEVEPQ